MIWSYTSSPLKHLHGVWRNCCFWEWVYLFAPHLDASVLRPEDDFRKVVTPNNCLAMSSSKIGSCSSETGYVRGRPQDQVVCFSEEITGTKTKRVEVSWFLFPLKIVFVAQILSMAEERH
jgi:hypothetical protein